MGHIKKKKKQTLHEADNGSAAPSLVVSKYVAWW